MKEFFRGLVLAPIVITLMPILALCLLIYSLSLLSNEIFDGVLRTVGLKEVDEWAGIGG